MSGTHSTHDNRTSGYNDGGAFGNTRDSGYGSGHSGNSNTSGPHKSNLLNKLDPRVDSDRSGQTGSGNSPTTHSGYGNTTGPSGTSGGYGSSTNYDNPRSANEGPHNSSLANKADPRVDSDRDGRSTGTGYGGNNHGSNTGYGSGNTGGYGNSTNYDNPRSANEGPHSSSLANKADPRVDSDRDGRATHGGNHHNNNNTGFGTGTGEHHGTSTGSSNYNNTRSANDGPHSSNLANKADPRVDSDRDGRAAGAGYGGPSHGNNTGFGSGTGGNYGTTTGTSNYDNPRSTNEGPHNSNIGNKLDPRVDSDRDNRGHNNTYGGSNIGSNNGAYGSEGPTGITSNAEGHGNGGSTTSTGGPHKSRLANMLDPRVDSNNPGSGTHGGQATANASVTGAGTAGAPEGQASASGPRSATANTTTSSNPVKGAFQKLAGENSHDTDVGPGEVGNNGNYRQGLGTHEDREAIGNNVARKHY